MSVQLAMTIADKLATESDTVPFEESGLVTVARLHIEYIFPLDRQGFSIGIPVETPVKALQEYWQPIHDLVNVGYDPKSLLVRDYGAQAFFLVIWLAREFLNCHSLFLTIELL